MSDTNVTDSPFDGLAAFTVGNKERWKEWVEANTDFYGRGVITYAARWANLMEAEIQRRELIPAGEPETWTADEKAAWQNGSIQVINETADALSHKADIGGITGFMYGAAVQTLSESWLYGEWLHRWHNKDYGHEDAEGVVNPAIITIGESS